jgi:glycerate-2-kinase
MAMIIKNRVAIETSTLRWHALDLIETGIKRVMPHRIMKSALQYDCIGNTLKISGDSYELKGRLFVIGGGKASGLMAGAAEKIVGAENITAGVVSSKKGVLGAKKIRVIAAGHPIPDQRGIEAMKAMMALKKNFSITRDDLILCLLSGGGSALMPYPVEGVSLADKQAVTRLLLASGAEIGEINVIRKHLSRVKGGNLGRHFAPAKIVSMILSDVVGNDIASIASGPTAADPSTFQDAYKIVTKYRLWQEMPPGAADYLIRGYHSQVIETPKALDNCFNYIVGDNRLALEAMKDRAALLGYRPCILTAELTGDSAEVAQAIAKNIINSGAAHDVFLLGGETTLKLPAAAGKGGRNQHYAAASIQIMKDYPGDWLVACVGTDGSDFIPGVAGAIVDCQTWDEIRRKEIDVNRSLDKYDSYGLLNNIGGSLLLSRDTGTNVGDVIIYMLRRRA